jgi:hypothetical protein
MSADVATLIGEAEALKQQVRDLYLATYTAGRATEPSPAPPHLDLWLIGVSGQVKAAEVLLEGVETELRDMADGNVIVRKPDDA